MAQQAPQQQGGGGGSDNNDMMWIAAFFAFTLVVLWIIRESYFPYIFKIKYYELKFISYFYPVNINLFHEILNAQFDPKYLSWQYFIALLNAAGSYYNIPVAIVLGVLAIFLYIKSPGSKFTQAYNIANFRNLQKSNWPQIIPPSKLDLTKEDIYKGAWASAKTPLNFARENKLLDVIVNPYPNPLLGELAKVICFTIRLCLARCR
jgi:hypothetical protein